MFRYRAKIITKIASAIAIVLYYLCGDTHLYLIPVNAATSCGKSRGVMILMVVTLKCLPFKKRYLVKRFCRKRTVTARIKNSKHFDLLSLCLPWPVRRGFETVKLYRRNFEPLYTEFKCLYKLQTIQITFVQDDIEC